MNCPPDTKIHYKCCLLPLLGALLWLASAISLGMAWYAGYGFVWNRDAVHWYWDALILGVLAIGLKLGAVIFQIKNKNI